MRGAEYRPRLRLLGADGEPSGIDLDLHLLPEIEARLPKPFAGESQGRDLVLILVLPADREAAKDVGR